jgi:hypothetical protein
MVEPVQEESKFDKKVRTSMMKSYVSPLAEEDMRGKTIQIYSVGILESMQKMMLSGTITEEAAAIAERSVFEYIDGATTIENGPGFQVLKDIIVAEKGQTQSMEEMFGIEREKEIVGVSMIPKTSYQKSDGCMFKILRKVALFLQDNACLKGKTVDDSRAALQKLTEDKTRAIAAKRLCLHQKREQVTDLMTKKNRLEKEKKEIDDRMETKALETGKLQEMMETTVGRLSEQLPTDGGDSGERGNMLGYLESMKQAAKKALDEMMKIDKKELAIISQTIKETDASIAKYKQPQDDASVEEVRTFIMHRQCVLLFYLIMGGRWSRRVMYSQS